ncbi:MBL fold metallo-hydrolase [Ferrimonas marina]|uniref:beta-lactamase n=1 Tax=Ferrimonas marina TaxID=299255 RepID=A0A1M5YQT6_9GAMM|nr:MBL fold metallo-hydrolase [Ferrimonas marina]SHI14477.1 Glyoxylase, beta-lactamase superfamily II [Ferrimonas marina]
MKLLPILCAIVLISAQAWADEDRFADTKIESQTLAPGISMLTGQGGNIGVSAGDDGLLIIDDQYAPLAERISAKLAELHPPSQGKPRFIINTHHHGDHTGGNIHFAQDGTVFAHDNVRMNMQSNEVAAAAWPMVTFDKGIQFHFNGDTIKVFHGGIGHTDGDAMVYFEQANVLHMGDLFFKDRFPFVDLNHGGSVREYLHRVEEALTLVNEQTQIIPGHGDMADKQDLARFALMLGQSLEWAESHRGETLEQWRKRQLPETLAGWEWGFITKERWLETLWNEMQEH